MEQISILKSYWWLITGVGAIVVWLTNFIFQLVRLSRERQQDQLTNENRSFWRGFGTVALAIWTIHLFSSNPDDHQIKGESRYDKD